MPADDAWSDASQADHALASPNASGGCSPDAEAARGAATFAEAGAVRGVGTFADAAALRGEAAFLVVMRSLPARVRTVPDRRAGLWSRAKDNSRTLEVGMLIDETNPFGARVAERLRTDVVAWLTVSGRDGTPHPNPIWFLWEGGDSVLVYNRRDAQRLRAIERNPRVALHFDSDKGSDVVIFQGLAAIEPDAPSCDALPEYVARYGARIARMKLTPAAFAYAYPVATRIKLTKLRGF